MLERQLRSHNLEQERRMRVHMEQVRHMQVHMVQGRHMLAQVRHMPEHMVQERHKLAQLHNRKTTFCIRRTASSINHHLWHIRHRNWKRRSRTSHN